MSIKQQMRPMLMAGAIVALGGLALIGGTRPAAAQYNPYCYYPYYDPNLCYGSDYYDYGYYPSGGGVFFGFGGGHRGGFRGGG
ncbi:MAG: hypothetical protein JO008_08925, partial [Alphaproteobacteria bacterium]|nr:hypothetical protein [Alphaproteobacteria bacterium]